jgi:hypothetical protein
MILTRSFPLRRISAKGIRDISYRLLRRWYIDVSRLPHIPPEVRAAVEAEYERRTANRRLREQLSGFDRDPINRQY